MAGTRGRAASAASQPSVSEDRNENEGSVGSEENEKESEGDQRENWKIAGKSKKLRLYVKGVCKAVGTYSPKKKTALCVTFASPGTTLDVKVFLLMLSGHMTSTTLYGSVQDANQSFLK